ncbi:MAG: MFS transporter [Actinomycetia bacterium]|nr:MFS transporter [Actinomycetes bacterium]MCH9701145.1 MFS transporter [Actinomycetes bacterium]MCH9760793.1 MFS transporter [Actinomycetes bacterium]
MASAPGSSPWPGWSPWRSSLVFGTAALFVFFQMVLQTFPSVMREGLVVDLSLNDAGFGGLSSSFYYPYILLQIPAGILVSRFGARAVLTCGALLCTVASFLFAMSHTANAAELTRILMGLGAAPTVVCAMTLAAQWFPRRFFPILAALTEVFGMTGAALGQESLGFIVERAGWRVAMITCGVSSAVLLVLILMFVRNRTETQEGGTERWPRPAAIARLLVSPPILSPALAGGLVASAGVAFAWLWGVSFFQAYHHMSLSAASVIASFYFWGCLPGMLGSAWLCSRYRVPARLLAVGAIGTALLMWLILFVLEGQVALSAGMFVLGFFNSFYALSFTMVKDKTSAQLSGVAMGLTNMLIVGIGGLIFQPLIGVLAHARGQEVPGAPTLSVTIAAPLLALLILAANSLIQTRKRRTTFVPTHGD